MAWFWLAMFSAFLWGVSYVVYERLLVTLSSATTLLISVLGSMLVYAAIVFAKGDFKQDASVLKTFGTEWKLLIFVVFVNAAANLMIMESVKAKNASLAGMVEITYPIFIVLITWLLTRHMQVSLGSAIGFLFIMIGVGCIYYFEK